MSTPRQWSKYTLGTYARGSRVQLCERWNQRVGMKMPGPWVIVVSNYASTTGVMVVRHELNRAIFEIDGRHPLFEVDPLTLTREHQ